MPWRRAKACARAGSRAATAATRTPGTLFAGRTRAIGAMRAAPSTPIRRVLASCMAALYHGRGPRRGKSRLHCAPCTGGLDMSRFTDRVAVVTGASAGIGAACARRFVAEGARVMLGDLDAVGAASLAKELDGGRGVAASFGLDVSDPAAVEALVAAAVEHFGRLDLMVNNAGIGSVGSTPDVALDDWRRTLAVDLDSVFYGCRAAIPRLRAAGGGAIVNTASVSGLGGDYLLPAYNAAKGGVVNLTRSVALDHAHEGIRCNAVCPGATETPMSRASSRTRRSRPSSGA